MALIPEDIIAQVIDRNDIVEVISGYIPLKKAGRNFKANCPFHHEKTPSFVVNPDKQIFHCFGCSVGGNVVSFVMKHEHMEFPEAIRLLAQKANITIPEFGEANGAAKNLREQLFGINDAAAGFYHEHLLTDASPAVKAARQYLKERGIELETVKQFRLGFAPDDWEGLLKYLKGKKTPLSLIEKSGLIIAREKGEGYYDRFRNRITFPIFDTRGACRAFGARAMDDSNAKYINSPETPLYTKGHHLYGFHLSKNFIADQDEVVIVEGYFDCIVPLQSGVKNIVASLGTALTVEQIRVIHRYTKNVVMLFDADNAGQAAMLRSLDTLIEEGMNVKIATLAEGEDPDSFVRKNGADALKEQITNAVSLFDYKLNYLMKSFDVRAIDGKAKIAGEMLVTVNKFENSIVRSEYVKRLSVLINVSEQDLKAEMEKAGKSLAGKYAKAPVQLKAVIDERIRAVEFNILRLLLEEESFIPVTKLEVALSDFQEERIRDVVAKIYENYEEGRRIDPANLIEGFKDPAIRQLISSALTDEDNIAGDKKKMHQDYIARLKQDNLKLKRRLLREEIVEAELSGDESRLEDLKEKFNQLIKG